MAASRRLGADKGPVLALHFANGVIPGGGFLDGSRAQEESLCRASTLYATLVGDPMYAAHKACTHDESSAWCILSPGIAVFRADAVDVLESPWAFDVLTCAAPVVPRVSRTKAEALMCERIARVLDIAAAYRYGKLVLGAWGGGAFGNDPASVADQFRDAIEMRQGAFDEIVFAIADWSPERRFLGPFRDAFSSPSAGHPVADT